MNARAELRDLLDAHPHLDAVCAGMHANGAYGWGIMKVHFPTRALLFARKFTGTSPRT